MVNELMDVGRYKQSVSYNRTNLFVGGYFRAQRSRHRFRPWFLDLGSSEVRKTNHGIEKVQWLGPYSIPMIQTKTLFLIHGFNPTHRQILDALEINRYIRNTLSPVGQYTRR